MKIAFVGKGGSGKTTLAGLLARHLAAAGNTVTLREVPGFRHMGVLLKLSPWYPGSALRDEIIQFLDQPGAVAP